MKTKQTFMRKRLPLTNETKYKLPLLMPESSLIKLRLAAPLYYAAANIAPFAWALESKPRGEQLFCFALNSAECRSIEPDAERLLGALLFAGQSSPDAGGGVIQLPAGTYLFVQRRESLNRESCLALALEQQKDGLWERVRLEDKLYIRYLFEDSSPVTQILRPCNEGSAYSRSASTM